jgi:periplasmic divalent cation tolerance protein
MSVLLVQTTAPDQETAERLAEQLVAQDMAACVKILAPCRSTYRWQDNIEHAIEIPMLIITDEDHYAALERWLKHVHPYDVPEILSIACSHGLPAYLNWVRDSSGKSV